MSATTTKAVDGTPAAATTTSTASKQKLSSKNYTKSDIVHRKILNQLIRNVYAAISKTTSAFSASSLPAVSQIDKRILGPNLLLLNKADASVTSIVGQTQNDLLLRIHECIEQIFLNGLRTQKPDVSLTKTMN